MFKKYGGRVMKYGYNRVSTRGQAKEGNSLEAQERAVREAGAEKTYADSFTGIKTHRLQERQLKALNSYRLS